MIRITLALLLSAFVAGCGGAGASTESVEPAGVTPVEVRTLGLRIERPAGPSDGYSGGLTVFRDTYSLSGGTFGHVNTGLMARTRTGKNQTAFEWTGLFLLDNYSDAGENVAMYAQANAFGKGPSWGMVAECTNAFSLGATCVGAEINVSTAGPDTGNRIGIDVVLADGPLWRGMGKSSLVEGTAGLRIGASSSMTYGSWKYGIKLVDKIGVGLDTTGASTQSAIRLREGQRVELDATGQISIDFSGGQIRFLNGNRVVHSFPMD